MIIYTYITLFDYFLYSYKNLGHVEVVLDIKQEVKTEPKPVPVHVPVPVPIPVLASPPPLPNAR